MHDERRIVAKRVHGAMLASEGQDELHPVGKRVHGAMLTSKPRLCST